MRYTKQGLPYFTISCMQQLKKEIALVNDEYPVGGLLVFTGIPDDMVAETTISSLR